MRTTIVFVRGAFAESASWDGVIEPLMAAGHAVVLVAHSYGGAVISNVDRDAGEIVGLVYVNGFAPEPGENCFGLAAMFPGSMLGEETVRPAPRSDGTTDLYIAADSFHYVFCQDVPAQQAALMAATQRPATQEALVEPSSDLPLWKDVRAWFLIGEEDRIIPVALQRHMAQRARRRDGAPDPRGRGAPRDRLRWSWCVGATALNTKRRVMT
jgi:pimeloyl-ACP methyl ester carboxylesterase